MDLGEQIIVDIASGGDHLLLLNQDGEVLSVGIPEQGQLGRLSKDITEDIKSEENRKLFLVPDKVTLDGPCDRIWAGHFSSFARRSTGEVYSWGLNRSSQLGFPCQDIIEYFPKRVEGLPNEPDNRVEMISSGLEHTLALDSRGSVYSFGNSHYGRLGYKLQSIKPNGDLISNVEGDSSLQPSDINIDPPTIDNGNHAVLNDALQPQALSTLKPELTDQQTPRLIPNIEKMKKIWTRSSQSFAVNISGKSYETDLNLDQKKHIVFHPYTFYQ